MKINKLGNFLQFIFNTLYYIGCFYLLALFFSHTGPRACPGKQLGETEMFIFTVSLLQEFEFKSVIPPDDLDIEGLQTGVTLVPASYTVKVNSRHKITH